jgi:DNA-binding transcriptional ArsR family regulator
MPGSQHRFVDERLAKALSHPLRPRILQRLDEDGVASPNQLAMALGEPLGNVSYHVRVLRELDCAELVRTEPRRGALEHFYRATARPWLDDQQWAALPRGFRARTLGRSVSEILEQASTASREGGFDGPETYVGHVVLALDADGLTELRALLSATLEAARQVAAESARRQAEHGRDGPPTIATHLAVMHFRHAETD